MTKEHEMTPLYKVQAANSQRFSLFMDRKAAEASADHRAKTTGKAFVVTEIVVA